MKINNIIIKFHLLLLLFSSCEKDTKMDYKSFLIPVDSVEVSDRVSINIPFNISFYGTVGTNGCYEFSHFLTEKVNNEILIQVVGQHLSSGICPTVMVYLKGEKLNYSIEEPGKYFLKIKQSDYSFLEKEIIVK